MSRTIWVTADTHFTHAEAIGYFARPIAAGDCAAMDRMLVDRINERVAPRDLLIHLGDFLGPRDWKGDGAERTRADAQALRDAIQCRHIELVRGNHDPSPKRLRGLFDEVHSLLSLKGWRGGDERIVCCHYPLRVWQGSFSGSFHLYGHSHGTLAPAGRSCDVGVDCWEYGPVRLDEVLERLAQEPPPQRQGVAPRLQPMRAPRELRASGG